ncbi:MAG: RNA ligase family protein [archaeon]|nr:RNA ligase family protein [archaeon]
MGAFYQKINSLYYRDEKTNKIQPERGYVKPEFELLKDLKWEATEKVDGINTSIVITKKAPEEGGYDIKFRGKTEHANMPITLINKLTKISETFKPKLSEFLENFEIGDEIELFGEGYGNKIQSGNGYLAQDVDFILFDIRIGKYWLTRESCEDIAKKLDLKIVPLIGYMTIPQAEELVKIGFTSLVAQNNKNLLAEGLVLRAPLGLKDRSGERLITKVKTCDWVKYNK